MVKSKRKGFVSINIHPDARDLLKENLELLRTRAANGAKQVDKHLISQSGAVKLALQHHNEMLRSAGAESPQEVVEAKCVETINRALSVIGVTLVQHGDEQITPIVNFDILADVLSLKGEKKRTRNELRILQNP